MFWKQWFKKKELKKSQLALVADVFRDIKPSSLSNVFSSDMSIFRLTVCKPTIEEYTEFLKMLTLAIEEDRQLQSFQTAVDLQMVYIRDFFTTKKQMMLNPVEASSVFIDQAVKFLTAYDQREQSTEKSFNTEKNLMLTQHVVSNLCVLSKEL